MLAPDPDEIKDLLTNFLSAYESITAAAIALQETQLFPPDPSPSWFGPLQTNLQGSQDAAGPWLTSSGPQAIARIPQAFITYNSRFQVVAKAMPTVTQASDALRLIHWLARLAKGYPAEIAGLQADLDATAADFSKSKTGIEDAIAAANQTISTDQDQVTDLQNKISDLYQKISGQTVEAKNGITQAATSGASMSIALLSYGFAIATASGPAFPIMAMAAGLISLTYGAVKNAINEQDIVNELSQIKDLQVQLEEDQQQVAVLQAITSTVQTTDDAILAIQGSVAFKPTWDDVNSQLQELISDLQQPGVDFRSLDAIKTFSDAAAAWAKIGEMALNIQNSASGTGDRWAIDLGTVSS